MDVREKLVELFRNAFSAYGDGITGCTKEEFFADFVACNGVTVQEWIPVDERLPENFISVLGYMTDAGEFPPVRECYTVGNAFFFPALGDVHPVSHWLEMPQPHRTEPITNADRIRAMSDEKLAVLLAHETYRMAKPVFDMCGYGITEEFIFAQRLEWLKQPAE